MSRLSLRQLWSKSESLLRLRREWELTISYLPMVGKVPEEGTAGNWSPEERHPAIDPKLIPARQAPHL